MEERPPYNPDSTPATVNDAVREYIYCREQHDIQKQSAKHAKAMLDDAERKMVDCFLDNDTTSLKTSGLTVSIAKSCRIGITLANTEAWLEWLKARGLEPEDYLRKEIVGKNLRDTVREVLKTEGRLAIPEALPVDETPVARVNGWAAWMKNLGVTDLKDDDAE